MVKFTQFASLKNNVSLVLKRAHYRKITSKLLVISLIKPCFIRAV